MQAMRLDATSFVDFDPCFISAEEAQTILKYLIDEIPWRVSKMTFRYYWCAISAALNPHLFGIGLYLVVCILTTIYSDGKVATLPRLQCWMSDDGVTAQLYQKEPALPWSETVCGLKQRLEDLLKCKFDYVLMNYYRDGNDSIGTFISFSLHTCITVSFLLCYVQL